MAAKVTPTSAGMSSPSESLIITSPTPSASSLSSSGFDFVTVKPESSDEPGNVVTSTTTTPVRPGLTQQPREEAFFSDDDEIVWGVSESEDLEGSTSGLGAVLSDDDFVVLGRTRTPVMMSRTRAGTSESTASQAGTIRGVPPNPGHLVPHPSLNHTRVAVEKARDLNDKDVIASELAKELAQLNVNMGSYTDSAADASGTISPIRETEPTVRGALPKKKGKKKERTPEEEALKKQRRRERKEKKEKKKQEKAAVKALKKDRKIVAKVAKDEEQKSKHGGISVTPVSSPKYLPPVAPELLTGMSTTTLMSSSSTNVDHTALIGEETPVPTLVPLPSSSSESVTSPVSKFLESPKRKKKAKKAKVPLSPQHDSATTRTPEEPDKSTPTPYDEAVSYITSYISNASAHKDTICHLTLLQSLIIELGLIKDVSLLPCSIKAAKKFIKPRVFLNVREYLTKRHEGARIVQGLMFPSRSALVKDMRKKKNYAPLKWIKERGLQDLLVGVFRH